MPKIKLPRKIRDPVKKANGGCGEAAFKLSRHYAEGSDGVENDIQIARQWLFRSAELGNADAQVAFAVWHKNAGENDFARTWWEKAAAQGSPDAAYNLGVLYDHGHGDGLGVEERTSAAAGWYLKAASKGMREAQNNYGRYLESTGHHGEAMTWYEKAAAQEHAGAMHNIAMMYLDGVGSERNLAKAREWWTRAAELGYEKANECLKETEGYGHDGLLDGLVKKANGGCGDMAWELGSHYYHGTGGVEKDKELSLHWVERAAELGHVEAQAYLDRNSRSRGNFNTDDLVKKANDGCGDAAWKLASHYYYGTGGVEKHKELWRHWLERAAELGHVEAQAHLASMLRSEGDYDTARKMFEKAAAAGSSRAEYGLGLIYWQGCGVPRNVSTAVEFLRSAASKGDPDAQANYGLFLAREMNEPKEAMKWYERAMAQGNSGTMFQTGLLFHNIGMLHYNGEGVPKNVSTARHWFTKAAAKGYAESQKMLNATVTEALQEGAPYDYVAIEKILTERVEFLGTDKEVENLDELRALKRKALRDIMELSGASISDDAVALFVSGPLPDHKAADVYHHLGLCFLHGRCGLEKNLRMAKEAFKVDEIDPRDTAAAAASSEELVKLRACVTCGKRDVRLGCKLCRGVRYCNKRCQQKDWARGTEQHPPHRETCSRVVNGIVPPGVFARLRDDAAKNREASN